MAHRILVVEDNEDSRAILRAILRHHGYEVTEVETAEEMFERLAEIDPALVILDIRLPGMDGCKALNMLREQNFDKPIFFFSEYYDLFSHNIRGCKADGFFPKSKGPLPLLEAVKQKLPLNAQHGNDGAVA